jgi:outer membrane protein assembly factor BamB
MLSLLGRATLVLAALAIGCSSRAGNWPQWRGPTGDGVSTEVDLPVAWSEHVGVLWKCKLPAWGNSTPVIWGNAIFLTSHVDNRRLVLAKIDKTKGTVVWIRQVGEGSISPVPDDNRSKSPHERGHQEFHQSQNLAGPSPVTDGQVVVVHFGDGELAAYDFDGRRLWRRNLQKDYGEYSIWWGHANSPVLYENLVISACMQDSCADLLERTPVPSYVVAHDKRTGEEVWRTPRTTAATAENCDSYATPIFRRVEEHAELVVMGSQMLDAYDPANGHRLWYLPGLAGNRTISGPVAAGGMILATEGRQHALLAVRPGGPGKRPRRDIVWRFDQGTPDSTTPVVWGDLLFLVTDNGVVRCLDLRSGRLLWKMRLKGEYRASPVAAEGRVYCLNTKGLCTILSAALRPDRLTENQLDDDTLASPAVSDGKLFLRGRNSLYCVGK